MNTVRLLTFMLACLLTMPLDAQERKPEPPPVGMLFVWGTQSAAPPRPTLYQRQCEMTGPLEVRYDNVTNDQVMLLSEKLIPMLHVKGLFLVENEIRHLPGTKPFMENGIKTLMDKHKSLTIHSFGVGSGQYYDEHHEEMNKLNLSELLYVRSHRPENLDKLNRYSMSAPLRTEPWMALPSKDDTRLAALEFMDRYDIKVVVILVPQGIPAGPNDRDIVAFWTKNMQELGMPCLSIPVSPQEMKPYEPMQPRSRRGSSRRQ